MNDASQQTQDQTVYRSGFVAVVGRPNVGKSTLINALIGTQVAIASSRPETTRKAIRGILTTDHAQIVLVDTPGIHRPRTLLGQRLNDVVDEYARISSAIKHLQAEKGGDCEISVEETGLELNVLTPELYKEMKEKEQFILSVTSTGYGKRTSSYEYRTTGRGGQGIANMEMSARNKEIVSSFPIEDDNQIMMVTDGGKLIRMPVSDIRIAGRKTQGVILFRTAEDERVVSVTWLDADAGDDEELEEETGSEVLGESVSEPDDALNDVVSEPEAAEDIE